MNALPAADRELTGPKRGNKYDLSPRYCYKRHRTIFEVYCNGVLMIECDDYARAFDVIEAMERDDNLHGE